MHTFATTIVFIIMSITHTPEGVTNFNVTNVFEMPSYEECATNVDKFNKAAAEDAISKNPDVKVVALEYEGFCSTVITGWKDSVNAEL